MAKPQGSRSAPAPAGSDASVLVTETRPDGTILIRQDGSLPPWPRTTTDRLIHWAHEAPDRIWIAERGPGDAWQGTSYAEGLRAVRSVAAALLRLGLSAERPLLILSGNAVAHAIIALGAQHAGIPSAALAPAYALGSGDFAKLAQVRDQLTPGLIFADHAAPFLPALESVFGPDVPLVSLSGASDRRRTIDFADLLDTPPDAAMEAANAAITPETVAKFLFTSGTTGKPKAVIQTHGMLCSNQAMVAASYTFLTEAPPVLLDWAPWNHTASGNKVFNMAIHNGGSYWIDAGRPTPDLIGRTLRNMREVAPTWYFNVPLGYQFLLDAMETDEALARHFFSRLKMLMYAGAGMSQSVWDRLTRLAERHVPGGVPIVSGLGATETGPFAIYHTDRKEAPGNVGIPALGVTLKLVPQGDRLEARLKSPSVTPGYWRDPDLTRAAFDDEGFYCLGDALRFAVPGDASAGFLFDGRLAENFKLASGTWVGVGAVRASLIDAMGGLVSDAVIAGENRDDLRALLLPNWGRLRDLAGQTDAAPESLARDGAVRAALAAGLDAQARSAGGSATRVVAALILTQPMSFERGEVTDKGSINQRAVLRERADLVESLYSDGRDAITPAGMPRT